MCDQVYTLWDNELNYVYQELKKILSDSEFQVLRQGQPQHILAEKQKSPKREYMSWRNAG